MGEKKKRKRTDLAPEDKRDAIMQVLKGTRTMREAAEHFNVSYGAICRWVRDFKNTKAYKKPMQSWSLSSLDNIHPKTNPFQDNLNSQNAVMRKFLLEKLSKEDLLDMVLRSLMSGQE